MPTRASCRVWCNVADSVSLEEIRARAEQVGVQVAQCGRFDKCEDHVYTVVNSRQDADFLVYFYSEANMKVVLYDNIIV